MMMLNKYFNGVLNNILTELNNDTLLIQYILISILCLILLNLNIIYSKKDTTDKNADELGLKRIININITTFISVILLQYLYDLFLIDPEL